MMRQQLLSIYEKLEEERKSLFLYLNQYDDQAINQQPGAGRWSAQQVINHLILSEKYSVGYCKKKLSYNPTLKKAGIAAAFKGKLVTTYFKLPLKIKAPKGIDTPALPQHEPLESIVEKWGSQRKAMKEFLDTVDDQYLDKEVYKHPFAGRLTLKGMMKFFVAHFRHHKKQIINALNHN
jgi:uncharacterized damage-inducible protein DinB